MKLSLIARGPVVADPARILEEAQTIVSNALAAVLVPERGKGRAPSVLHQQTVSEAKEEWRNEGNPN